VTHEVEHVVETAESFAIPWNSRYRIEGLAMVFEEASGRLRSVLGYPVREIEQGIRRMKSSR